jgi:hypothetical protein
MIVQPCAVCGEFSDQYRCPEHRLPPDRYGRDHRRRRSELLPHAWGTRCPLCGEPMLKTQRLELDHSIPLALDPASKGDRIVHEKCNRARRGRVTR